MEKERRKVPLKFYINIVKNISQREAAKELGFSLRTVNSACNGLPVGFRFRRRVIEWSKGQVDVVALACPAMEVKR